MKLSPLSLHGVLRTAFSYSQEPEKTAQDREPVPVTMYQCHACEELHALYSDAKACCDYKDAEQSGRYKTTCPVCATESESTAEAAECCLWKDLLPAERERVAAAVDAGDTWAEALGVWPAVVKQ